MAKQIIGAVMTIVVLFSGQVLAHRGPLTWYQVDSPGVVLRHQADSDELRNSAENAAESLREHHHWATRRKPPTSIK